MVIFNTLVTVNPVLVENNSEGVMSPVVMRMLFFNHVITGFG